MVRKRNYIAYELVGMAIVGLSLVFGASDVMAASSISVSVPATLDLEIVPSTNGSSNITTGSFVVATKNTEGFRVLLHSDSTALTNNHHADTISSIVTPTKLANLPTNTWGVYFGATAPNNNSNFMPISIEPTEVARNDLADASGTYKLAIGVKADTSLPAGMYSNNLVISVVAGAPEITSLDSATYMQDVTPEICANTKIWESEDDSAYLIDKRDEKVYKVARLKDGNCWMQESLAMALSVGMVLTSDDSDVIDDWTSNVTASGVIPGSTGSYAAGGNYSVATALAGTQNTAIINGEEYTGSICPKGWKLPLGGSAHKNSSGSLYNLVVTNYGVVQNARDAAKAPMYLAGDHDYVTRNAYNSSHAWTDRIYAHNNYASWLTQEPFTDSILVRCVVISADI